MAKQSKQQRMNEYLSEFADILDRSYDTVQVGLYYETALSKDGCLQEMDKYLFELRNVYQKISVLYQ